MKPQDSKAVKSYCKRKGGLFDEAAKLKGHKKLNQVVAQLNQQLQGRHARHLFFFNPVGQTLDTLDHLILTTKGLVLIEQVPTLKQVIPLDEQWWQHEKTGQLRLSESYRLTQIGTRLNECLSLIGIQPLPIFTVVVSDQAFLEEIKTLDQIIPTVQSLLSKAPAVVEMKDLQRIERSLTENMENTLQTKLTQYNPNWVHTNYNPLQQFPKSKEQHPLLTVYQTMNEWIQEEAPEAALFHEVTLESGYVKTILVCQKGMFLFDYLESGAQVKVELNQLNWTVLKEFKGEWQESLIPNPVKRLDQQAHQIIKTLKAPVPLTYRIVGLHPIDLEFKHPSLALELHLKPALSKCQQEQPQVLTEAQLLWVKQQLSQLIA